MSPGIWFYVIGAFAISVLLTSWVRKLALERGIIDHPNARSSHSIPIPRGGGLAIVATTLLVGVVMTTSDLIDHDLALALLGGLPVAWIGFRDDRGSVSVGVRLAVHAAAAIWAMYVLGGLPAVQIGENRVDLGMLGHVLGTLAIMWSLNLFNFMDGIDGIAASEAVFAAGCGGLLWLMEGEVSSVTAAGLTIAAASAGFLCWNWPPAKIFMGDVGSSFLGFVVAVIAIAATRDYAGGIFVWLILGAVFIADATATLLRRLLRAERVYEAHRSHAYQILSQRWGSHLPVTLSMLTLNGVVLLPLAWLAMRHQEQAWLVASVTLVSLAILAFLVGAGRTTSPPCDGGS